MYLGAMSALATTGDLGSSWEHMGDGQGEGSPETLSGEWGGPRSPWRFAGNCGWAGPHAQSVWPLTTQGTTVWSSVSSAWAGWTGDAAGYERSRLAVIKLWHLLLGVSDDP